MQSISLKIIDRIGYLKICIKKKAMIILQKCKVHKGDENINWYYLYVTKFIIRIIDLTVIYKWRPKERKKALKKFYFIINDFHYRSASFI